MLPVMVVSVMDNVPPKSLLVQNKPPPKAFCPAALLRIASPHKMMFFEAPSLYSAPPLPPEPISCWSLLMAEHLVASSLFASWPIA